MVNLDCMWVMNEEGNMNDGDGSGFRGLLYLVLGQAINNGRRDLAPREAERQAVDVRLSGVTRDQRYEVCVVIYIIISARCACTRGLG